MAKIANLLTDGYAAPDRLGLLLPLHWQTACLLLGGVASGATVVVAREPADLADCPLAFVTAEQADGALDAGVEDVFVCSLTPFATRLPEGTALPPMVLDAALEIPGYGDHFGGRPQSTRVLLGGVPFDVPAFGLGGTDRVLVDQDLSTTQGLGGLLGALRAGAAVVLVADGDLKAIARQEGVTAWFDAEGLLQVGEGV